MCTVVTVGFLVLSADGLIASEVIYDTHKLILNYIYHPRTHKQMLLPSLV